jgi:hypothetical protein
MTSKPVPALLSDLAILKSHSRPKVSNDNPYGEKPDPGTGSRPASREYTTVTLNMLPDLNVHVHTWHARLGAVWLDPSLVRLRVSCCHVAGTSSVWMPVAP